MPRHWREITRPSLSSRFKQQSRLQKICELKASVLISINVSVVQKAQSKAMKRPLKIIGVVSIVALTLAAVPESSAQTSGEEAERLKPYADKSHPSFLEAGIFFMTGHEPPNRVKFQLRPDGHVSAIVKRLMDEPNRSAYDAIWEFKLSLDKHCTIMAYRIEPPYAIERLEFMNLPGPRAMRTDPKLSPYRADIMDLPHETWCHAKAYMNQAGAIDLVKDTTMCDTGIAIGQAHDAHRRLAALDYIRANFCPGQPEPPPPPRKPY